MRIKLNDEWLEVEPNETIAALLARLGIDALRVAVERNFEIVPKARYADIRLEEGDRLEVVHFVGGG